MKKIVLLTAILFHISCVSGPYLNNRGTASETVTADATPAPAAPVKAADACSPSASSGAIEIIIDKTKNELSLVRDGRILEGYPVFVLISNYEPFTKAHPQKMGKKLHVPKYNWLYTNALLFQNNALLHGNKTAEEAQHWSKERMKDYKSSRTGFASLAPKTMERVYACISNFKPEHIEFTVK